MPRSPVPLYTWRFSRNISVSQLDDLTMRAELLYQIKQRIIGGGSWTDSAGNASTGPTNWSVHFSCDGVTAGTDGDAVDRWVDNGDLVWDTSGSAHSWVVFRNEDFYGSGLPLELLIQTSQANSATRNGTVGIWKSQAGFTGGSTTARPTATDEHEVLQEDGTTATNSSGWQGADTTGILAKVFHFEMTSDGSKWRVQICDGGFCEATWDLFRVESAPAGWSRPSLMAVMSRDSASENNTWSTAWNSQAQGGRYHGWDSTLFAFICQAGIPGYGSGETPHVDSGGNSFSSGIMPTPIPLRGDGSPVSGHVAVIPDCWWVSNTNGTGDHAEDDTGVLRQFVQFGEMMYLWDRSTAVVS